MRLSSIASTRQFDFIDSTDPLVVTGVAAAIETAASLLKGLFLASRARALHVLAVVSFVVELVTGLFLTIFVVIKVFTVAPNPVDAGVSNLAVRGGTLLVALTETLSILSEGISIYTKLRWEASQRQRRRQQQQKQQQQQQQQALQAQYGQGTSFDDKYEAGVPRPPPPPPPQSNNEHELPEVPPRPQSIAMYQVDLTYDTNKRPVLHGIGTVLSLVVLVIAIFLELNRRSSYRVLVFCVLGVLMGEVALFFVAGWTFLYDRLRTRVLLSVIALVAHVGFCSGVLVWGGLIENETVGENGVTNVVRPPYDFKLHTAIAVFVLGVAFSVCATSRFRLSGFQMSGRKISVEQALFIETVLMAAVPPTVVLALTDQNRDDAAQLALTFLPQINAVLLPVLLEFDVVGLFGRWPFASRGGRR